MAALMATLTGGLLFSDMAVYTGHMLMCALMNYAMHTVDLIWQSQTRPREREGLVYLVYLDLYPLQDFCSPMMYHWNVTHCIILSANGKRDIKQ